MIGSEAIHSLTSHYATHWLDSSECSLMALFAVDWKDKVMKACLCVCNALTLENRKKNIYEQIQIMLTVESKASRQPWLAHDQNPPAHLSSRRFYIDLLWWCEGKLLIARKGRHYCQRHFWRKCWHNMFIFVWIIGLLICCGQCRRTLWHVHCLGL